jgi:hypothetical protein
MEFSFLVLVPQHTDLMRRAHRCATGAWRKVEKKRENLRNKKSLKFMKNVIFKNNKMIRILAN